jgi:hypothetical protein
VRFRFSSEFEPHHDLPRTRRVRGEGYVLFWLFLQALFSSGGHRGVHFASLSMLILFVVICNRLSKPINRLQTEAAKTGGRLDNARELQASWDRSVMIRIPLLVASLLAQCMALPATSA